MRDRITIKDLRALCDRLNKLTDSPMQYWGDGKANVGNYHISQAYGGYALHRVHNQGGGITTPLSSYHRPARELWEQMQAYLHGFEDGKEHHDVSHP